MSRPRQFAWIALACFAGLIAQKEANADDLGHKVTSWEKRPNAKTAVAKFSVGYKAFLGAHKTEREVVSEALRLAKKAGHLDLLADKRPRVAAGQRLLASVGGKLAAIIVVGKKPVTDGLHVVATHIDSVRIDLKQNPLYDDANLALLQTHYYGGIKKYQWLSVPLELRGIVVTKAGKGNRCSHRGRSQRACARDSRHRHARRTHR